MYDVAHKFTGKERDSESGLDNFGARYYTSQMGRFMSTDPGNAGASLDDPQSWNAYSYVRNSPLSAIDPTGLDCIYLNAAGTGIDHILTGNNQDCTSDTDSGYYVNGTVNQNSIIFGAGYMGYSYSPWNDSAGVAMPYTLYGQTCVGTCQDMSVTVHGTVGSNTPTMSPGPYRPIITDPTQLIHYTPPTSLLELSLTALGCSAQVDPDLIGSGGFNNRPAGSTESTSQTQGQGQTQVTTGGPNGGQEYGNNRPIIPNFRGGGRNAGTARNLGGALNFVNSAGQCGSNAATPR